eukprot:TRINITY_DN90799_c0_g1_i1.p1 TRINITY_DN90799_c0_g1~~TRINITY_DN90799_c0_g1_i1.p1  ORF type:complete len:190 (-),score=22.16 TRINITY_DN90799_c0_g1_i1:37-555(-)
MRCFALAAFTLPLLADAQCKCDRYRCRNDAGAYEYSLEQMLSDEATACIRNSSAYTVAGECRYCPSSCDGNICECQSAMSCDWFISRLVPATSIALGVALLIIALWSLRKWYRQNYEVKPYDDNDDRLPWQKKLSVAVVGSCIAGVGLIVLGIVVWYSRELIDEATGAEIGT